MIINQREIPLVWSINDVYKERPVREAGETAEKLASHADVV